MMRGRAEELTDGYHTMRELYDYRAAYNALLFNEWSAAGKYDVVKSTRHADGEPCFGGSHFVVYALTPIVCLAASAVGTCLRALLFMPRCVRIAPRCRVMSGCCGGTVARMWVSMVMCRGLRLLCLRCSVASGSGLDDA